MSKLTKKFAVAMLVIMLAITAQSAQALKIGNGTPKTSNNSGDVFFNENGTTSSGGNSNNESYINTSSEEDVVAFPGGNSGNSSNGEVFIPDEDTGSSYIPPTEEEDTLGFPGSGTNNNGGQTYIPSSGDEDIVPFPGGSNNDNDEDETYIPSTGDEDVVPFPGDDDGETYIPPSGDEDVVPFPDGDDDDSDDNDNDDDDDNDDPGTSQCNGRPYPRDIDGHWAEIYIRRLYDLCIVEGYKDGTFRPEQNVSRAELVKMSLYSKGIKPNFGCYDADCGSPFMDLDMWQGPWIRPAWDLRIVQGYSKNRFAPNQAITRAEGTKVVLATYGYHPLNVSKSFFNDVHGWSVGWIEQAHQIGLVQGVGNGNFDPNRSITRAESAKIIAKMVEFWDTKIPGSTPYYCDTLPTKDPRCTHSQR